VRRGIITIAQLVELYSIRPSTRSRLQDVLVVGDLGQTRSSCSGGFLVGFKGRQRRSCICRMASTGFALSPCDSCRLLTRCAGIGRRRE